MPLTLQSKDTLSAKSLRHPYYILHQENWEKWRLAYVGGSKFLRKYLRKFSRREDDSDYLERLKISYNPAFAKAAINEVKNSIFQRLTDVTRVNGPESYQRAVLGLDGGVDLNSSGMNIFIGRDILPELLVMGRVGIYVDMPIMTPNTSVIEKGSKHPYLYWYKAEDIRSWIYDDTVDAPVKEFKAVLLRDNVFDIDPHWNLPYESTIRYRYVWVGDDGYVKVRFYNEDGETYFPRDIFTDDDGTISLNIKTIPFTILEISDSLMTDAADYQIALLNLASADMAFATKANFPFYTEQFDWRTQSPYTKQTAPNQVATVQTSTDPVNGAVIVQSERSSEIRVGVTQGRRYPIGLERPGFINPSPDPMLASMEKQKVLKEEVRQLVLQAVSSLTPKSVDNDSEDTGIEAGLSYIAQEIKYAEHRVAIFWAMYEGGTAATVQYPQSYSLVSPEERQEAAKKLIEIMPSVPSITFQKELAKKVAKNLLSEDASVETLSKIYGEIDSSPVVQSDPDVIKTDIENGLVSLETASKTRGYPDGEVEKAKQDHAERLARIAQSQGDMGNSPSGGDPASRGVSDRSANPKAPKEEKDYSQKDQTKRDQVKDRTRGEGK